MHAYHRRGIFENPTAEDVTAEIRNWEVCRQSDLRKLAALIRRIIDLVKDCGGIAVLTYIVQQDKLTIRKVERQKLLPDDLYSRWDSGDILEVESSTRGEGDSQEYEPAPIVVGQDNESVTSNLPKPMAKNNTSISADARTLQTKPTEDNSRATIKIGETDYLVFLSKIPYLAAFVRSQKKISPSSDKFLHNPIDLFDVAFQGIERGYRQFFRNLPTDLSHYRVLFETYRFLNVNVLNGLHKDEVIANLKAGRSDFDPEERRKIPGNKNLARDTAFQLLYLILNASSVVEAREKLKIYNAVLFIMSHPGTFKYRTKKVIHAAYDPSGLSTALRTGKSTLAISVPQIPFRPHGDPTATPRRPHGQDQFCWYSLWLFTLS